MFLLLLWLRCKTRVLMKSTWKTCKKVNSVNESLRVARCMALYLRASNEEGVFVGHQALYTKSLAIPPGLTVYFWNLFLQLTASYKLSKTFIASSKQRVEAKIILCQLKMKSMCVYLEFFSEVGICTTAIAKRWFLIKGVIRILHFQFYK